MGWYEMTDGAPGEAAPGEVVPGDGYGIGWSCLTFWGLSEHVITSPGIRPDVILKPLQSFVSMNCIYLYFLLKLKMRKNQMYIDEFNLKVTDKPKRHDLWSLQHLLLCFLVQPAKKGKLHSWLQGYTRGWQVAACPHSGAVGGYPGLLTPHGHGVLECGWSGLRRAVGVTYGSKN